MSFHGPCFLLAISWILRSKKECLVVLTVFLNCFQSLILLNALYFLRSLLYFTFHQLFEYLIILTIFKFFSCIISKDWAKEQTVLLREIASNRLLVLMSLMAFITFLIKIFSFSLSLTIIHFLIWIYSLIISIMIVSRAWSDAKC